MGDKNTLIIYIIASLIIVGGFVMVFLTRTTTVLAAGAILIFIGLFILLFGMEKAKKKTS